MKQDKKQHILCGAAAAVVVGFITYLISGEVAAEPNVAAGVYSALAGGVIAGGVKEWCDMRTEGNKWDWLDFGCTVIGAVLVALLILGLHFGKG